MARPKSPLLLYESPRSWWAMAESFAVSPRPWMMRVQAAMLRSGSSPLQASQSARLAPAAGAVAANNAAVATSTLNMRMICSRGSRSGSVSLSDPEGNAAESFPQPPSAAHDCAPASAIDFVGGSAREVAGGCGHHQGLLLPVGNAERFRLRPKRSGG